MIKLSCYVVGALAALSVNCSAMQGGSEDYHPLNSVLRGLQKRAVNLWLGEGEINGQALYNTDARNVRIQWVYPVAGLHDGYLLDPTKATSEQHIALAFWPTEVLGLHENVLAVAGVSRRGRVLIKLFEFEEVPLPAVTYSTEGDRQIPELTVPVLDISTVYDESADEVGPVSFMFRDLANPDGLYFQELNSRLKWLNTRTGDVSIIAAPADLGNGVMHIPNLTLDWQEVDFGTHETLGNIYYFFVPNVEIDPNSPITQIMMLRDTDRDGTLDDFVMIDSNEAWIPYAVGPYEERSVK